MAARRLVGAVDMSGDEFDRLAGAIVLACAFTDDPVTTEDIRRTLELTGLGDTPEHVAAVQRRLRGPVDGGSP